MRKLFLSQEIPNPVRYYQNEDSFFTGFNVSDGAEHKKGILKIVEHLKKIRELTDNSHNESKNCKQQ